jgi:hypothetical protein
MNTKTLAVETDEAAKKTQLTEEQLDAVSGGFFLTKVIDILLVITKEDPITTYAPGHCPGQNQ